MSLEDIYNRVYKKVKWYDEAYEEKLKAVEEHLPNTDKSIRILDIGCGKGHYIRRLISLGYKNITGVEFSSYCCETWLDELNVINANWLELGPTLEDNSFDLAVCMDVLEHIEPSNIQKFVSNIERTCNEAILGIANHSDIMEGEELHLIQQGVPWWTELLKKYYSNVDLVYSAYPNDSGDPKFFILKVSK